MVLTSINAATLVCISLLNIAPGFKLGDIAPAINLNFPGVHAELRDVLDMLNYLDEAHPAWADFYQGLDTQSEGFKVTFEFLELGLLAPKTLPADELTSLGLMKTMGRIIFYARQWGIGTGAIERRQHERTPEGDAAGYFCDENYCWWDHPGNFGF